MRIVWREYVEASGEFNLGFLHRACAAIWATGPQDAPTYRCVIGLFAEESGSQKRSIFALALRGEVRMTPATYNHKLQQQQRKRR